MTLHPITKKTVLLGLALALLIGVFFSLKIDTDRPHHTDSIWYASIAREMVQTGDWVVPHYQGKADFWKPPLHYWLIASSYKLFGVSAVSAVLPSLFLASLGIFLVWLMGNVWFGPRGALIACLILATNAQYYEAATLSMMDLGVAIFILLALFSFFMSERSKNSGLWIVLFFVFSALGVLQKSFQGIAIPLAVVILYSLFMRKLPWASNKKAVLFGIVLFSLIAFPWFIYMNMKFGSQYSQFIGKEQILGRFFGDGLNLHWRIKSFFRSFFDVFGPFTVLILFVISSVCFAIKETVKKRGSEGLVFLLSWILVVFGLFSLSVSHGTRYFMPIVPAVSLVAGWYFSQRSQFEKFPLGFKILLLLTFCVLLVGTIVVPVASLWILPQNYWYLVVPFVTILVISLLLLVISLRLKHISWIPFILTGFIGCILVISFIMLAPILETKPNVHFVKILNTEVKSDETIGSDTYKGQKELVFFGQGKFKTQYLGSLEEIQSFLKSDKKVFCLLKEENFEALPQDLKSKLVVLDTQPEWKRVSSKMSLQAMHHFILDAQSKALLVTNQGN